MIYQLNLKMALALVALLIGIVGCGKSLKLSVKTEDSDQARLHTGEVRRVEVTYQNALGKEEYHQSIGVKQISGLLQIESDIPKNIKVKKDGYWGASAFSESNMLLFQGVTQVDPDETSTVIIPMGLSKVVPFQDPRVVNAETNLSDIEASGVINYFAKTKFSLKELIQRRVEGKCLELTPIKVSIAQTEVPNIAIQTKEKDTEVFIDVGITNEVGDFKSNGQGMKSIYNQSLQSNRIEIGKDFHNGRIYYEPQSFVIQIYSGKNSLYEGCFSVVTEVQKLSLHPLQVNLKKTGGYASTLGPSQEPIGMVEIINPNPYQVQFNLKVSAKDVVTGESLIGNFRTNNASRVNPGSCVMKDYLTEKHYIGANQKVEIYIFELYLKGISKNATKFYQTGSAAGIVQMVGNFRTSSVIVMWEIDPFPVYDVQLEPNHSEGLL